MYSEDVFGVYETGKKLHSALAFTFVPANELVFPTHKIVSKSFIYQLMHNRVALKEY